MLVPLADALGCVLAADVRSPLDVPAFVTCDVAGYAVKAADITPGAVLRVVDDVPAGFLASERLDADSCIRVARGAPLPDGADAVIEISQARLTDNGVHVDAAIAGHGVRVVGSVFRADELLARAGVRADAGIIGKLAQAGIRNVDVHPRPRVLVLTVGSEYVEPGVPTPTGLVADHLSLLVAACAGELGGSSFRLPPVLDGVVDVVHVIEDNCHRSDLIVLCGLEPDEAQLLATTIQAETAQADGITLLHGRFRGVPVIGFPDDSGQVSACARGVLPDVIDALSGYPRA